MKKFKVMLAFVLGIMCIGVTTPIKADTVPTADSEVRATPRASYKVAYVPCGGWTVVVHYQVNVDGANHITSVVKNSVSSDSPAGYWGEAVIVPVSKNPYVWTIRIDAKIRALGAIQATNSITINVTP